MGGLEVLKDCTLFVGGCKNRCGLLLDFPKTTDEVIPRESSHVVNCNMMRRNRGSSASSQYPTKVRFKCDETARSPSSLALTHDLNKGPNTEEQIYPPGCIVIGVSKLKAG